ncbi:hypothetical protein Gasu2_12100 [Galdieria sulphuraria]|uniref:6-pyruvoyltetrahydropterin synthase n=1 Tax=Galdieria sulphuraria TaxID=130081 RepID=M2W2B4_GALSU|nr:6-pyruvoyl tetrahydropterin synthase [Galdieria sulphuraria]EME29831.1 6-pyruvoyl tetrahydropterin synthase [Galdieria sulphuraria]GJD06820.1 hypothetical protein Gasu2_12100 [Galdieria sulphuraria]|eukprot:XP_005706351.1 6-pyruvoyl tetrahydropterin synthase [Galdieria sulphuraria]
MYTLGVRDSFMIAHSFQGEAFGPAQGLHGATYTVDCEFRSTNLQPQLNWVIDIGEATQILKDVLSLYNYRNLDQLEEFQGQNTTTEYLARVIHDKVLSKAKMLGFQGILKVSLMESFRAWASYESD